MESIDMAGHLIRRLHQLSTQVFVQRTQAAGYDLTPVQFAVNWHLANERITAKQGVAPNATCQALLATGLGVDASADVWQRAWDVNVMGTVHATAALLPGVRERGRGYLLITASAAGLLTNLGDAPYSATKHAAVGLAEWLSITHHDDGLRVSCLCPQGVRTPMLMGGIDAGEASARVVEMMGIIDPTEVAGAVVEGLGDERFLILPHPEVAEYVQHLAADPERWLGGMRKLQRRL